MFRVCVIDIVSLHAEIPHTEKWRPCQDRLCIDYPLVHHGKQRKASGKSFCGARSNSVEERYGFYGGKQLAISKLKLEEIMELPTTGYMEDISLPYEQIAGLIKRLEISKDGSTSHLIDSDRDLEYIKQWNAHNKESKNSLECCSC